ncbi:MAG: DUF2007 domain-containing protein [Salinisphaera sp.]|nr:DUF2007 domain-containing protein [Salinisphaera sp.]
MASQQVYIASDPANAQIVKDYLGSYGIHAQMRGYYLWGGMGELPANVYPTLWVADDAQVARARRLVARLEAGATADRPPWQCDQCGESLAGQFDACWRCGAQRDDD